MSCGEDIGTRLFPPARSSEINILSMAREKQKKARTVSSLFCAPVIVPLHGAIRFWHCAAKQDEAVIELLRGE
jgi:hypothetical protein